MHLHPFSHIPPLLLVVVLLLPPAAPTFNPSQIRCTNHILPTPTYGLHDALFTVCSEICIDAPIPLIYTTLLNFSNYHTWNTFVVAVDLPPGITTPQDVYVGMPMNFTTTGLIPLVNTTSMEVISVLEPGMELAVVTWGSRSDTTMLEAEHPTILTDVGGGRTRSVSYETYYGAGAVAVLALEPNLQREFEVENENLKSYVEGLL